MQREKAGLWRKQPTLFWVAVGILLVSWVYLILAGVLRPEGGYDWQSIGFGILGLVGLVFLMYSIGLFKKGKR